MLQSSLFQTKQTKLFHCSCNSYYVLLPSTTLSFSCQYLLTSSTQIGKSSPSETSSASGEIVISYVFHNNTVVNARCQEIRRKVKMFITQRATAIYVTREAFVLSPELSLTNSMYLVSGVYSKNQCIQKMSENVNFQLHIVMINQLLQQKHYFELQLAIAYRYYALFIHKSISLIFKIFFLGQKYNQCYPVQNIIFTKKMHADDLTII